MAADLSGERFTRLKAIFVRAANLPSDRLPSFLDEQCAGDAELRQDLQRLLEHHSPTANVLPASLFPLEQLPDAARFQKLEKIGSGGFGDVYKVLDQQLGVIVALKTLRVLDPAGIGRFKKEFRLAATIGHRNIARVYELNFDEAHQCWYFTMEFIDGVSLLQYLRHPARRGQQGIGEAFRQLALGIGALHQAGILHRDLKPSNVLVTSEGRLVLLDFGLAREFPASSGTQSMTMAGTPDYIAPETIAGERVTPASDWYSFGVMLYEVLAGRPPFQGTVLEILEQKSRGAALAVELPQADPDLLSLCLRLLLRDPALRPTGQEVLATVGQPVAAPIRQVEAAPEAPFMGRGHQLKTLQDSLRLTEWGRGITVHIHGLSGMGKTALVSRFLESLQEENGRTLVLKARCYESESFPYKAVDELIERLARHLKSKPWEETARLLPRHFDSLAHLFPALEPLAAAAGVRHEQAALPDSHVFRRRAFAALRELLGRMADQHPVVVFIDDFQWGDVDSAALLSEVMAAPEPPPLLLLLAYRSDEISSSEAIQILRAAMAGAEAVEMELGPLEVGEARALSRALLAGSGSGESLPDEIAAEAERSPFLIEQLCLHARLQKQSLVGKSAAAVLGERIAATDAVSRRMLELLSVAAAPLRLEVLLLASDAEEQLLSAKARLLSEKLIRSRGPAADSFELYHDGLRKAVLSCLSEEAVRRYHERIAAALAKSKGDAEAIAQHYRQAGLIGDAVRYAELAAEEAESVLAFGRAAGIYRFLLSLGVADEARRREVHRCLGEALIHAGQGADGARALLIAADGDEAAESLRLRIRAATELLRAGEVSEGSSHLSELLRHAGMRYPHTVAGALWNLAVQRARLAMRGLRPATEPQPFGPRKISQLEVCWAIAVGTSMVNPLNSSAFCARYLRLALDSGDSARLAIAYAAEATQRAHIDDGKLEPSRYLLRLANSHALRSGDPRSKGFVLTMTAVVNNLGGRWADCVLNAKEAIVIFREQCRGVEWELTTATTFLFSTRYVLGDWQENNSQIAGAIQNALLRGDKYAAVNLRILGTSYGYYLTVDQPLRGLQQQQEALDSWPHDRPDVQQLYVFFAQVEMHLYMGKGTEAWQQVQGKWDGFWRNGLLRVSISRVFGVFMRGRAALAAACCEPPDSPQRLRLLRLARRCASHLDGLKIGYGIGMANLLRAGISISMGERTPAAEYLRSADTMLSTAGMRPWVATARLRLASISPPDEAERIRASAFEWFTREKIARPEGIADMFCPGDWDAVAKRG